MTRRTRRVYGWTGGVIAAIAGVSGCASAPAPPPRSTATLTTSELYRPGVPDRRYRSGDRTIVRASSPERSGSWLVRDSEEGGDLLSSMELTKTPGGIAMAERTDAERGSRELFEPPLLILPSRLDPDTDAVHRSRVRSVDSRGRTVREGDATARSVAIECAEGLVGVRIEMRFEFGPADVRQTLEQRFDASTRELVSESRDLRVRTFGITVSKRERELQLIQN